MSCVVGAFAFVLLGAGAFTGAHPTTADHVIRILSVSPSYAGDTKDQEIRMTAKLETGNSIDVIRVTLDAGTPSEKIYEFDVSGRAIGADDGLADAHCNASFGSDGYSIGPSVIDCSVLVDDSILAAGTHQIRSEIVTEIGTFTDDSELVLLAAG
jgi:hypothetical protein